MNFWVPFFQMIVLFGMMATGFFCYKKEWMDDSAASKLSKVVVNIFNPLLVINGVLGESGSADGDKIRMNLILVVAYFAILILFGYLVVALLRPKRTERTIYRLMSAFSNVGFMGIPVTKCVFGDEAAVYVAFYILVYNLLLYTYGTVLTKRAAAENGVADDRAADRAGNAGGVKKAMKQMMNPGVAASLLAIIIFGAGIQMPDFVINFCDYMGNATVPLSMFLIGVTVAQADVKSMLGDMRTYLYIVLRMLGLPILLILLMKRLPIDPVVFGVFIIEIGMPVGGIVTIMTKESGADADCCTRGTVLSTLASILTIPVICMFL